MGVNQNAMEEVNLAYTANNGVKVVRRLTGGGAVYHDGGNLCYTVISPYDEKVNNYQKFTAPVIEYLKELGITAEFTGRNDITVDGKKISGNAQTVYKGRIMHHGTILFSSDLDGLTKSLNPSKIKVQSKGIKSVRSRVTNLYDHINPKITIEEFKLGLKNKFLSCCEEYSFSEDDIKNINKLVKEKYSTYEWNIARSPKGKNTFSHKFPFGIFTLNFDLENGIISNVQIFGDFFELKPVIELSENLNGVKFVKDQVLTALKDINLYILGADGEEITKKIFNE